MVTRTANHGSGISTIAARHTTHHSQCPTKVAAAVASAPYHKQATPRSLTLSLSSFSPPAAPLVCCVVLSVSMGVKTILKHAEATEAAIVLTRTGQVSVASKARMKALAAVSPNRAKGPWNLSSALLLVPYCVPHRPSEALTKQQLDPHSTA